jgi:hypothetical protein
MNERLLRMAADMFIPVGERQGMINDLYEFMGNAREQMELFRQMREEISYLRESVAKLLIKDLVDLTTDKPSEVAEIAEQVAVEVAEEVAQETVIAMDGQTVNLDEGLEDTRESKGDYPGQEG